MVTNLTDEQAEDLDLLLNTDDYSHGDEDGEAFELRFDSITANFLATIDEAIPRLRDAHKNPHPAPAAIQKELDDLKKAIFSISDEAREHIADTIDSAFYEDYILDEITGALNEMFYRLDKVTYEKKILCNFLCELDQEFNIHPTAREELVEIICSSAGIKLGNSMFRQCMEVADCPDLDPTMKPE
jgi:hypothetical protein